MASVELGAEPIRNAVESFLPYSFTEVNKFAIKFRQQERRHVYTTPKSFLELLKLYTNLLAKKNGEMEAAIDRLAKGLQKLRSTASAVAQIEADLNISLADAEQKKTVAEGIAEVVSKEKAIVEVEVIQTLGILTFTGDLVIL
jgi:dynein heavy chain